MIAICRKDILFLILSKLKKIRMEPEVSHPFLRRGIWMRAVLDYKTGVTSSTKERRKRNHKYKYLSSNSKELNNTSHSKLKFKLLKLSHNGSNIRGLRITLSCLLRIVTRVMGRGRKCLFLSWENCRKRSTTNVQPRLPSWSASNKRRNKILLRSWI